MTNVTTPPSNHLKFKYLFFKTSENFQMQGVEKWGQETYLLYDDCPSDEHNAAFESFLMFYAL